MKKIIYFIMTVSLVAFVTINTDKTLSSHNRIMLKNLEALASDKESNNSGTGNKFYYEHLLGKPKSCTLYKHVKADGSVKYTTEQISAGAEWTSSSVDGLKETCPDSGKGCTAYSCTSTN